MFDTKSSYILSKLGIQRFQRRKKSTNPEDFFGLIWNDILTLLDKSVNELKKNEFDLLTKIVKSAFEDGCEMPASKEISNVKLMHCKPKLLISFVDSNIEVGKNFHYVIKTKPLHILEQSINDKKILWSKIKEFKNESSTGKL